MHLQKLDIQGFKSFAQKTSFHFPEPKDGQRGITAVVGPNGSGKSNVADAIRWVLGEQSKLLLRSKKAEDVIFFGSARKAQLGFCEVSLVLNNEDHAVPLDYTEIDITRRLYRDGESEFLINGSKVRLADVALLAAQAQLGSRTVSVIGQGMIEGIINASPAERKEYFSEASGVKQYQLKKDQAVAKLKSTDENLVHARTVLFELEPKIKFFRRQLKRMEERSEVEKEYRETAKNYYSVLWNDLSLQISEQYVLRDGMEEVLKKELALYGQREKVFLEKEHASPSRSKSMEELRRKHDRYLRDGQSLHQRKALLDGRLQSLAEHSGDAQGAWIATRLSEVASALSARKCERENLSQELAAGEEQEKQMDQELQAIESHLSAKRVTDEELRSELQAVADMADESEIVENTFQSLQSIVTVIRQRIQTLLGRLSAHHDVSEISHAPLVQKKELMLQALGTLRLAHGGTEGKLSILNEEIERLVQEEQRLQADRAYFTAKKTSEQEDVLQKELDQLQHDLVQHTAEVERIGTLLQEEHSREKDSSHELVELQRTMAIHQKTIDQHKEEHHACAVLLARLETQREELAKKIVEDMDMPSALIERELQFAVQPQAIDREATKLDLDRLRKRLDMIGSVDPETLDEYETTQQRYDFLHGQVADLESALMSLQNGIIELNIIIREQFDAALEQIDSAFQKYFKTLFSGGSGRIMVVKREQEQETEESGEGAEQIALKRWERGDDIAGVEIYATPPDKKLKNLSALSGGEKAMTAIALLCAIISNNPSPFVVLDEVDAALDDSNAHRFAAIVQELSTHTQFILVTHNRVTIHTAEVLYGVTMGEDGISKVLSLDIERAGAIVRQ